MEMITATSAKIIAKKYREEQLARERSKCDDLLRWADDAIKKAAYKGEEYILFDIPKQYELLKDTFSEMMSENGFSVEVIGDIEKTELRIGWFK